MDTSPQTPPSEADDDEKIRAAALDYTQGWYAADAARMERALHPELAKRAYLPGADGAPELSQMSAMTLIQLTRRSETADRHAQITILDRFEGAASVRATMADWVDYLHLVKVGTDWKIINVLWELTPAEWSAQGGNAR